jgi:hypothetical protein
LAKEFQRGPENALLRLQRRAEEVHRRTTGEP